MKKIYFLFYFLFITGLSYSQEPFITMWEVTEDDLTIAFNQNLNLNGEFNYNIDFGDGTILSNQITSIIHNYESPGVYTVSITGDFPRFLINSYSREQLMSVEQWGDIEWSSMESAFDFCPNLVINATDAPDLSQVTNLNSMFRKCTSFNQSIEHWDVSNINNMSAMFVECSNFNQPLANWDVSNVTDMSSIFFGCTSFNQPLANWDVSNVANMAGMFFDCTNFNQSIDSWNVSNNTSFFRMFRYASSYNQPMDNWDVSNGISFPEMFYGANLFNQSIDSWDISNATVTASMFFDAISFNQPLNSWNVSNVSNFDGMFRGATAFNQPLNNWDMSNAGTTYTMFLDASSFNQPLNNWNMSNVEDSSVMFKRATSFNQPLNDWDMSNVIVAYEMFSDATSYNQSFFNWNLSSIEDLYNFVTNSGLDVVNYDSLLQNIATSNIQTNFLWNCYGLEYCNASVRDYLINVLGYNIYGDTLSPDCNIIFGTVFYDENSTGCDNDDFLVDGLFITANSEVHEFSAVILDGNYSFPVIGAENYTLSIVNVPVYFTVSPEIATVDFTSSSSEQINFCLTANQVVNDLSMTILPLDDARPGFESKYILVVENIGTETINNITTDLIFNDTKQSFVSAIPTETSASANNLSFMISSLNPFQKEEIEIIMQTYTTPTVNGDDILNFTATVLPDINDYTPDDNTFNLEQIVVNSYDPNDKSVLQGDYITVDETDYYLDYIIRFQNTGTANATSVRIEDYLHADLDWTTIKMTSASHDYDVKIINGNEVEFIFNNINLPYEAIDAFGSNGYIAYKIKPKNTVQIGDIMSGNASIYFDFNLPIVTNTVSIEVISNLSVDDFSIKNLISIYPNPTDLGVFIKTKDGITVNSVTLHNIQGTQLFKVDRNLEFINTKEMASGIYILSIDTNRGKVIKKLIIE